MEPSQGPLDDLPIAASLALRGFSYTSDVLEKAIKGNAPVAAAVPKPAPMVKGRSVLIGSAPATYLRSLPKSSLYSLCFDQMIELLGVTNDSALMVSDWIDRVICTTITSSAQGLFTAGDTAPSRTMSRRSSVSSLRQHGSYDDLLSVTSMEHLPDPIQRSKTPPPPSRPSTPPSPLASRQDPPSTPRGEGRPATPTDLFGVDWTIMSVVYTLFGLTSSMTDADMRVFCEMMANVHKQKGMEIWWHTVGLKAGFKPSPDGYLRMVEGKDGSIFRLMFRWLWSRRDPYKTAVGSSAIGSIGINQLEEACLDLACAVRLFNEVSSLKLSSRSDSSKSPAEIGLTYPMVLWLCDDDFADRWTLYQKGAVGWSDLLPYLDETQKKSRKLAKRAQKTFGIDLSWLIDPLRGSS